MVAEFRLYMMFLVLRPIFLGYTRPRAAALTANGCPPRRGGTQEIFGGVSEDLLGGTAKAEDAKPFGVLRAGCQAQELSRGCGNGEGRNGSNAPKWFPIVMTRPGTTGKKGDRSRTFLPLASNVPRRISRGWQPLDVSLNGDAEWHFRRAGETRRSYGKG
jgi:hypothetical protein